MKFYLLVFILSTTFIMIGCTFSNIKEKERSDYFEWFNRSMYRFNYKILDPYVSRPIAIIWRDYAPYPIRKVINNFISNIEEPATMINYLLQGKPYQGMIHFTRFFLNTTVGIGGFIDIAGLSDQKLQREKQRRFGNTLGYYGIRYGPYIHLPFYGGFTFREEGGNIVDIFYPVLSWIPWPIFIGKWILESIETRIHLLKFDNFLHYTLDPYIIVREIYFQDHEFISVDKKNKVEKNLSNAFIKSELTKTDIG